MLQNAMSASSMALALIVACSPALAGDKTPPPAPEPAKSSAPAPRKAKNVAEQSRAYDWVKLLVESFTRTLVEPRNSAGLTNLVTPDLKTELTKSFAGTSELRSIRRALEQKLGHGEKARVTVGGISLSPLGYEAIARVQATSVKGTFNGTVHCSEGPSGWRVSFFNFGEFQPAKAQKAKKTVTAEELGVEVTKPKSAKPKADKPKSDRPKSDKPKPDKSAKRAE